MSSDPNDAVDIDELFNDYHHFSSNDERENAATIQKVADKIFAKEGISISDQTLKLKTYAYQIVKNPLLNKPHQALKDLVIPSKESNLISSNIRQMQMGQ